MSRSLFRLALLPAFLLLSSPAHAGTFDMSAAVDHDHLELGESLRFTLSVRLNGRMDFAPQIEQPTFPGFQVQGGPAQSQNISWVNGAMSMQQSFTWELVAQKSGDLVLGPYHATGKDALAGNLARETKPITVHVSRPKNLGFTLPSQNPGAEPTPDEEIRDIKADRPFPWGLAALAAAALAGLAGFFVWWWLRPVKPKQEFVPRDPAQLALEQLERLRQALQPGGEADFVKASTGVLRQYLRFRLDLRNEATLAEALRALQKATGCKDGAHISLKKRIPLGGGLAGGSTDAAAALKGLNQLWSCGLSLEALAKLAATLGSDIPFCLRSGWALATGRGEKLKQLSLRRKLHFVLLNPGFEVSTKWAYQSLGRTLSNRRNLSRAAFEALQAKDLAGVARAAVNDLEPVTSGRYAEIRKMRALLDQEGAQISRMSGSGPSVWGLFKNEAEAKKACQKLKNKVTVVLAVSTNTASKD